MKPIVVSRSDVAGGAERYLVSLYTGLKERGHTPTAIGHIPGWDEAGLITSASPLGPKWGGRSTLKRLPRLPFERASIAGLASETYADVFHVQFKREQIGLTRTLGERAPVLWTEHGRFTTGAEGKLLAYGYRRAAQHAAAIVCVADLVARDVRAIVGSDVRVEVIPNAVDTRRFQMPSPQERQEARLMLNLPLDAPVVAWVGRLDGGKLPFLAAAVAEHFEGILVMAGRGPLEVSLHKRSAQSPRLKRQGFLPDPSVLYRAADALLFTSAGKNEGLPYVILEAASHGLPLVVNKASGLEGVAAEIGGRSAADHPEYLADALRSVCIRESGSPLQARRWAEGHDLQLWLRRHEDIMRDLSKP
jgi:glycosyltransferase involved in cell wall biosynthesis